MTQAGNLYMFVMHNPVRWVDPTGLIAALPMGTGGIFGPIGPLAPGLTPRVNIPGNPGLAGGFNAGIQQIAFNPPSTITPEGGGHASRPITTAPTISPTGNANPNFNMSGFNNWVVPTSTTATSGLRGFGGMGFIGGRWHMGSDFYGSNGRDVVAVADGLVMRVRGPVANSGTMAQSVIIRHEGPFTVRGDTLPYIFSVYQVYGPNGGSRDLFVQPGDTVTAGQLIARNGTLPLHFEVRRPSSNTPNEPDNLTTGILNSQRELDWNYHIDPRWIFADHTTTAFNQR